MKLLARKLPTILGLLMLVGMAAVGWWWVNNRSGNLPEEIQPKLVRITNNADNKFTVSWVTSAAVSGRVEYGLVGSKLEKTAEDDRGEGEYQTHHVTVSGLQPSSQYAFRIISGGGATRFDNNGRPYSTNTGPVIGGTPAAERVYGEVKKGSGQPASGAIVYLALPGGVPTSSLVTASGNYSIPLSTVRSTELERYLEVIPETTAISVEIQDGQEKADATVLLGQAEPIPLITMGESYDFVNASTPAVAEVEETNNPETQAETPTVFNVEPLGDGSRGTRAEVRLLNPSEEGEVIATTLPEFRGLAPSSTVLSITVHSSQVQSETVVAESDGTWSWSPSSQLTEGEHTITIAYIDSMGIEQVIERSFRVSKALANEGDPSFEATPSASTTASPSPTPSLSPSPIPSPTQTATASPRAANPSTESGVPVSGITEFTWLTATVGLVIMIVGASLLVL